MRIHPFTAIVTAIVTTLVLPLLYLLLQRIRSFSEARLQYLVEGAFWHASHHIDWGWASRVSLAQYTRAQLASASNRYLLVPGTDQPLETDDVYIPLALEAGAHAGKRYTADTLLEAGTRLTVVGDPGSGKSTLTKVLLRQGCRAASDPPRTERLPILLPLKDVTPEVLASGQDAADGLLNKLRDEVGNVHGYEMHKLFDSYLDTVGVLILFDGLDEVSTANYSRVADALRTFSGRLEKRSPESAIVLTMRTHFFHQVRDDLKNTLPVTLFIQDFSPSDIYDFLMKWPSEDDAAIQIGRIYAQLTDSPGLRDLCTNPLILAMYVANYQSTHAANLPDTRTNFYRKVMDELLVARRSRQLMVQARESLLEQREAILGKLAFENLMDASQSANSVSWERALQVVTEVTHSTPSLAERSLREIIRDTGIISEERLRETLRFNHLTFCEFLAARECTEGRPDGWPELLKQQRVFQEASLGQTSSRLNEVIPFTAALMKRVSRAQALQDVADLDDRVLFIRCILETQSYDHPSCDPIIGQEANYLWSFPEDQWDEEWLRRIQLFSRFLRDAKISEAAGLSGNYLSAEAFFNRLVDDKSSRLLRLFSRYASDDAAAALRLADHLEVDLVQDFPHLIVENCDNPAFRAMAIERANLPESDVPAWSAALAEAGLRFQVVALSLHGLKRLGPISAAADRARRRFIWYIPHFPLKRRRSLYTDCITVACSNQVSLREDVREDLRFVNSLRAQRAPGRLTPAIIFIWPIFVFLGLVISFMGLLLYYLIVRPETSTNTTTQQSDINWVGFAIGVLVLVAILGVIASFVFHPIYRSILYQRLLNIFVIGVATPGEMTFSRSTPFMLLNRVALSRLYRLTVQFERTRAHGGTVT